MEVSFGDYLSLSSVMFLEFAVWGAWAPILAARLLGPLAMTGKQTGWIYATLPIACISEPYDRVRRFELQAGRGDTRETLHRGTALGENFETRFAPVTARQVRLNLLEIVEGPSIWEFQLFHDVPRVTHTRPLWVPERRHERPGTRRGRLGYVSLTTLHPTASAKAWIGSFRSP